jgi:hypothetical protein
MVQRSLVTVLAALGGFLVVLGGVLGFLLSFGPYGYGPRFGVANLVVIAALAVIFGIVIVIYSGITHLRSPERSLTDGLVLMVLGIVTWVIAGEWLLVSLGSFLTVLAGVVLVVLVLLHEPTLKIQTA